MLLMRGNSKGRLKEMMDVRKKEVHWRGAGWSYWVQ